MISHAHKVVWKHNFTAMHVHRIYNCVCIFRAFSSITIIGCTASRFWCACPLLKQSLLYKAPDTKLESFWELILMIFWWSTFNYLVLSIKYKPYLIQLINTKHIDNNILIISICINFECCSNTFYSCGISGLFYW